MVEYTPDDFLAHYGKRGMKWGVRGDLKKLDAPARASYLKTKDAAWKNKVEANPKLSKVSRIAARDAKRRTKKLKADYKAQGKSIRRDLLARTRYDNELKTILEQSLDRASFKVHKTSPSRLNEVVIHRHPDGSMTATIAARSNAKIVKQFGRIAKADENRAKDAKKAEVRAAKVVHTAIDEVTESTFIGLEFLLVTDDEGFVDDIITPFDSDAEHDDLEGDDLLDDLITDMSFSNELKQSDLLPVVGVVDNFLAHYGKVGMKWGRRRRADAHTINLLRKQANSEDHNAAHDLKGKSLNSLSNAQIKTINSRMQLETTYKNLTAKPPTKGERFIKNLLKHGTTAQSVYSLATSPMVKNGMLALGLAYAPKHSKGKVSTDRSLNAYQSRHRK